MVSVEKIVLKIGKKTLEMTADEVKSLKEALDKMFGSEKIVYRYWPNYPWTYTYSNGNDWTVASTDDTVRIYSNSSTNTPAVSTADRGSR